MAGSSVEAAPTSIKHRFTTPQSASMAERPRPIFDQAWAVKDLDDENEAGLDFHLVGSKNNHTKSKEGKDLLDDWDAMLKGSCFSRCNNSTNLMNFVKAFFLTSGFPTPRAIVYFNRADPDDYAECCRPRLQQSNNLLPSHHQRGGGNLRGNPHCERSQ